MRPNLSLVSFLIGIYAGLILFNITTFAQNEAPHPAIDLGDSSSIERIHGPYLLSQDQPDLWFLVFLEADHYVLIDVDAPDDVFLAIYHDRDGEPLAGGHFESAGSAPTLAFNPNIAGQYYLRIYTFSIDREITLFIHDRLDDGSQGDEWDPMDDVPEGATPLGTPTEEIQSHGPHSIGLSDRYDWFSFHLEKGETYLFETEGNMDTVGDLFDSDGERRLASNDDSGESFNFRLIYTAPESGRYTLRVQLFDPQEFGFYVLQYQGGLEPIAGDPWDPWDDIPEGATPLGTPTTQEQTHGLHTLSTYDQKDWFLVTLEAEVEYLIFSTGPSRLIAQLYESDAETPAIQLDAIDPDPNFIIRYVPPVSGDYYLEIRSFDGAEAAYMLHYLALPPSPPPLLDPWDPKDDAPDGANELGPAMMTIQSHGPHSLSRIDTQDWFAITLNLGETYEFWSAGASDTVITLFDTDVETALAESDGGGQGYNFHLRYSPNRDGRYFLRIQMRTPGVEGEYLLYYRMVRALPADGDAWDPTDDLPEGATHLGAPTQYTSLHGPHTLSPDDREDWFRFTLFAGALYEFTTRGEGDTVGELFYSDALTRVAIDDDSGADLHFRIFFTPEQSGLYYLRISAHGGEARYDLHYSAHTTMPEPDEEGSPFIFPLENLLEFMEIPGGFEGLPHGSVSIRQSPSGNQSAAITVGPGEVTLLQFPALPNEGDAMLMRTRIQSSGGGATIALSALDASLDGSVAVNLPADSECFAHHAQWLVLLFTPHSGMANPLLQAANLNADQEVTVYFERLEIYRLPPSGKIPAAWFNTDIADPNRSE